VEVSRTTVHRACNESQGFVLKKWEFSSWHPLG
jgi:hypothetical protein